MLRQVQLHPKAQAELHEAVCFYRKQGNEALVARFKQEIGDGFDSIVHYPRQFPPVPEVDEVRKYRLRNFPFSILYISLPKKLWVVAIAHGSRRPGFWIGRSI